MRIWILSTIFFNFLLIQTALATPVSLTTSLILHSFPICKISSSLEDKCQTFSDIERVNFVPIKITDAAPDFINEESLDIVTEDWNYSFTLEVTSNNTETVVFVDDAKFGSFFVATKYYLEWKMEIQNWVIVGEEVTYIYGTAEDKKIEGKYFAFSSPISFVTKK
jgi:hypothetical protein